jgi:large subunit ribosomal protein L10
MKKQEKARVVASLSDAFKASQASFLINFKGMTVLQMQNLRRKIRQDGGTLQVAKARLMKRAVQEAEGTDTFVPYLKDQLGIVFARDNAPLFAKTLNEFAKKNESFKVVACFLDNRTFDSASVLRIAHLPPREVMLAQLCGVLKAPARGLVGTLNMVLLRLLLVLQQVAQKQNS